MEKRVKFDFEIYFTNGGNIKGQDFRLDIEGDDISDFDLANYIIADLRLLMAGETKILNKVIFSEKHKRKPINVKGVVARHIDLGHIIESGMVTYKGLPSPAFSNYLAREASREIYTAGTEFQIDQVNMVGSTGTYLDSPFHRYQAMDDIAALQLGTLVGLDAIVIHVPFERDKKVTSNHLRNFEIRNRAVLLHTGWDVHWGSENYFYDHPFITADAAEYLSSCGVKLVGIDSCNIDNTQDQARPAHSILLRSGIPIVEHLCDLHKLPDEGFTFTAVPPRLKEIGSFPVRAFATLSAK